MMIYAWQKFWQTITIPAVNIAVFLKQSSIYFTNPGCLCRISVFSIQSLSWIELSLENAFLIVAVLFFVIIQRSIFCEIEDFAF